MAFLNRIGSIKINNISWNRNYLIILFAVFTLLLSNCSNSSTDLNEIVNVRDSTDIKDTTDVTDIDDLEEIDEKDIIEGPLAKGCPNITYPDWKTSKYVLPYPVGESYQIDLSNCSGSYHSKGKPDEFAIDFNMDIGTLITASRPGKVIFIEESGFDGSHPNNLVVIDHGDDTYAEYMHLTNKGALVEVGDSVKRGDAIGLSGSTGLAGYPHLHFVVAVESWNWPYKSVPVTFRNTISNVNSLASGKIYQAFKY